MPSQLVCPPTAYLQTVYQAQAPAPDLLHQLEDHLLEDRLLEVCPLMACQALAPALDLLLEDCPPAVCQQVALPQAVAVSLEALLLLALAFPLASQLTPLAV